jgi:hypothetical protein
MNQYGTNPTGPVGPIGLLVVTGTPVSGTVALANTNAGKIYQVSGNVTFTISSPPTGTFWLVQNTTASSVNVTFPTVINSSTTISLPAGRFVALVASATNNIVPF